MSANSPVDDAGEEVVVQRSRFPYEETVRRLSARIVESGNRVFATIDQRAAARDVGLDLRPTTLLIFGNPHAGTPLMADFPLFALELPLKLLVWDMDGEVRVAYASVASKARRYGVTKRDGQLAAMDAALDALVASVR